MAIWSLLVGKGLRRSARKQPARRPAPRRTLFHLTQLEDRCVPSGTTWTQRGGNAGHTNYVDVSVNPAAIGDAWNEPLNYASSGTGSWAERGVAIDDTHVYRTQLEGYAPGGSYHILAYDLQTGALLWNQSIVSVAFEGVGAPSVAGGLVYVNRAGHSGLSNETDGDEPRLYGLSAQTGAPVVQVNYAAQWASHERPVIDNNQLVAWDGYYGGMSEWTASSLTRQWNDPGSIYNEPLAALDSTYVYAYGNQVYLRSNGGQQQSISGPTALPVASDPMVSGSGRLFYDVQDSQNYPSAYGIAAYDGTTHALLWYASTPTAVLGKAVGNGVVAVTSGKSLILLNEATGAQLMTWQAPDVLTSDIILTRTHAFVETSSSSGAHVYAVNLLTGQSEWSFTNTQNGYQGSAYMQMAFGGGHLLLSHDSFVHAFTVPPPPQVLDNGQAGFSESGPDWTHYTGAGYNNNLDYAPAGSGADAATWQIGGLTPGTYDVQMTWTPVFNHATNATYTIYDGNQLLLGTVTVNQQQAPSGTTVNGTPFQSLGHFTINSGTLRVVLANNANGYVIADAMAIASVAAAPQIQVSAGSQAVPYSGSFSMSALVGQAATQTFSVTNTGGATLTLSDPITLPSGFSLASDFGIKSLSPGQSTSFTVRLNTASSASYSGSVSFGTNVSGANPFSFTLSGTVASSALIDNGQAGFSESGSGWTQYTGAGYNNNLDYAAAGGGSNTATWQFTGLPAGGYTVQMSWTPVSNHATNATYAIYDGSTLLSNIAVNQQQTPGSGSVNGTDFQTLGQFQVNSGTLTVVLTDNANGYVIADAARIVQVPAAPQIQVSAGSHVVYYNYTFPMSALVGQSASQTFTVTNTGGATLTLSDPITLPAGFSLSSDFGSTSLAPGQSTTFVVQMNTSTAASYSGSVSFGTNVSNANPFKFTLSGTVVTSTIIDNGQAGFSEAGSGWTHYTGTGYNNTVDYAAAGTGANTASWQLTGLASGTYDAQVTWNVVANHATNATYSVYDGNTLLGTVTVNQQQAPSGPTVNGTAFQSLGLFQVNSGTLTIVLSDNANGYVIADAFRAVVS